MSTREMAYSILDQLTETELQGSIALFGRTSSPKYDDMQHRREAFEKMEKLCRYIPDLDEKKALDEYREEKYGS